MCSQPPDSRRSIWITEFGAPTGGGTAPAITSQRIAERRYVVDAVTAARADDGIAALFWCCFADSGADPIDPESHYGLRRADGSPKPAYDAFRQVIAGSPSSIKPSVLGRWNVGDDGAAVDVKAVRRQRFARCSDSQSPPRPPTGSHGLAVLSG